MQLHFSIFRHFIIDKTNGEVDRCLHESTLFTSATQSICSEIEIHQKRKLFAQNLWAGEKAIALISPDYALFKGKLRKASIPESWIMQIIEIPSAFCPHCMYSFIHNFHTKSCNLKKRHWIFLLLSLFSAGGCFECCGADMESFNFKNCSGSLCIINSIGRVWLSAWLMSHCSWRNLWREPSSAMEEKINWLLSCAHISTPACVHPWQCTAIQPQGYLFSVVKASVLLIFIKAW